MCSQPEIGVLKSRSNANYSKACSIYSLIVSGRIFVKKDTDMTEGGRKIKKPESNCKTQNYLFLPQYNCVHPALPGNCTHQELDLAQTAGMREGGDVWLAGRSLTAKEWRRRNLLS